MYDDAIAVCKKCGKAMCGNCSAYSGHSGICPECRRSEFIVELQGKLSELKQNKKSTYITIALAVLAIVFAILIMAFAQVYVGLIIFLITLIAVNIRVFILYKRRKPITDRINFLKTEIGKLTLALQRAAPII